MTTEIELHTRELQQQIPHLVDVSEEGWSLRWSEPEQPTFEVVCTGATLAQIQKLEKVLNKAYEKAQATI